MPIPQSTHQIGPYVVTDVLGEGGMGTVYRGRDPRFDRPVAIKLLHPQLQRNAELVARFKAEAVIQAKLNHPNIVSVLDFVADEQHLAIVMEFVEGVPLDRMIEQARGPLFPDLVATVFSQVLSGIGFAHARGLVHRDLKPSNILVQTLDDGEILGKIADFGVAKILGTDKLRTATAAKMGTLAYMSPEHLRSPKSVDARSDLYSLGVALFEALTGSIPFDADTEYELMRQIVETPVPPARSLNSSLPSAFDAIVTRATAKDPAQRFQNATEFKDALLRGRTESIQAGTPRAARPPRPPRATQEPPFPPHLGPGASGATGHSMRTVRILAPWAIMLAVAGTAAFLMQQASAPEETPSPTVAERPAPVAAHRPTNASPVATPTVGVPHAVATPDPGQPAARVVETQPSPVPARETSAVTDDITELASTELAKLRGVAAWSGETVKLTVYNGTQWRITQLAVRLHRLVGDAMVQDARPVVLLPPSGPADAGAADLLLRVAPGRGAPGLSPGDSGTFEGGAGRQPDSFRWEIESARGYVPSEEAVRVQTRPAPLTAAGGGGITTGDAAPPESSDRGFAIQVGAYKDRASAESVVSGLRARGLPAYVVAPLSEGLFSVRVGVYPDRADAERVAEPLRADRFRPFVIRQ